MSSLSVAQHVVALGGHLFSGFGEGDIEYEPNADHWNITVGIGGAAVRTFTADDTYMIRIPLLQTSLSNDVVSAIMMADEKAARAGFAGAGILPFVIKDLGGTTLFKSPRCFVRKPPTGGISNKNKDRVWELCAFSCENFLGGNPF